MSAAASPAKPAPITATRRAAPPAEAAAEAAEAAVTARLGTVAAANVMNDDRLKAVASRGAVAVGSGVAAVGSELSRWQHGAKPPYGQ